MLGRLGSGTFAATGGVSPVASVKVLQAFSGYTFDGAASVLERSDEVDAVRVHDGVGVDQVPDFSGQLHEGEDLALGQWSGGRFCFAFLVTSGQYAARMHSGVHLTFACGLSKSDSESDTSSSSKW
jgi:hypothetical protein